MQKKMIQKIPMFLLVIILAFSVKGSVVDSQAKTDEEEKGTIIEKTENRTVYSLGNGKCRAEIYNQPVRYKDEEGVLRDYDTSLADSSQKGYAFETESSDKMAYFPKKLTDSTPVISESGEYQAAISTGASKGKGQKLKEKRKKTENIYGNREQNVMSLDYEGVIEDATLQYQATRNGLKENVVLDRNTGASKFEFQLRLENCYLSKEADQGKQNGARKTVHTGAGENLYLYDAENDTQVGEMPYAFMTDANGSYSENCTYKAKLKKQEKQGEGFVNTYALTLSVDPGFLKDKERKYPVTIDPTVTWSANSNKDFISSAYVCRTAGNTTYHNTRIICVGNRDTTADLCRSYINFDGINTILADSYIDKASLKLRLNMYTSGMTVYARRPETSWTSNTITYNNQPKRAKHELGSTVINSNDITMDLDPDGFYEAVRNKKNIHGIELTDNRLDTNTTSSNRMWLFTECSENTAYIPKLEVTYYKLSTLSMTTSPQISYTTYGSSGGWTGYSKDGVTSGSLSDSNPIRAFGMSLTNNGYDVASVKYRANFDGSGWTGWKNQNEVAGSTTQAKNMKTIQMRIYDSRGVESNKYDVYYRVYTKDTEWLGWAKNGQETGNYSPNKAILGIQAVIVPRIQYYEYYMTSSGIDRGGVLAKPFTYCIPVGDQNKVYGLAAYFMDQKMRDNHKISIVTYKKTGTGVGNTFSSGNGEYGSALKSNPLVGYSMQFGDTNLRAKYNIEHMTSFQSATIPEETWKKNTNVSGVKTGSVPLEMVSIRAVPKDYREGEKLLIPYSMNDFSVTQDGFSFINSKYHFNYPSFYKFSLKKYQELFGTTIGQQLYNAAGDWPGNCYGMVLTNHFIRHGMWDINNFKGNIDQFAESPFVLCEQRGRKSTSLRDAIEYVQLSFSFGNPTNAITDYAAMVKAIQNNRTIYYMYVGNATAGHAVIPLSAVSSDGEHYTVTLYDVNREGVTCTADVNVKTNTFSYGDYNVAAIYDATKMYTNNKSMYDKIQKKIKDPSYVLDLTQYMPQQNMLLVKDAASYEVLDNQGTSVEEREDVEVVPSFYDKDLVVYYLPDGEYSVKLKKVTDKASISLANDELGMKYTIQEKGKVNFKFARDKSVDAAVKFAGAEGHKVSLETYDKSKNKRKEEFAVQELKIHGNNSNNLSIKKVR